MPDTNVQGAAEGMPTEFLSVNRILELAREISGLLDRVPGRDFVLIWGASQERPHHVIMGGVDGDDFKPEVGIRVHPPLGDFIRAQDKIDQAVRFSRLVFNAIESMELDNDIKAISAGVYEIEKHLSQAQELLEDTKDALSKL